MATTKRKRRLLNVVMVALAAVVVVAGVAFFVSVRGGQGAASPFVVESKVGYANIERAGINYALDEGTALQEGDVVEALGGSEVGVKGSGEATAYLADASKMQVKATEATPSKAGLELVSGCIFADARSADEPLALEGAELAWSAGDAVFVSDVRAGAVAVQVLSGEVAFADGSAVRAGESRTILTGQAKDEEQDVGKAASSGGSTGKLTLGSLDSFALSHALDAVEAGRELVFSKEQIGAELERRENERFQQSEQAGAARGQDGAGEAAGADGAGAAAGQGSAASGGAGTSSDGSSEDGATDAKHTCTIQIRCDTILNNMDKLAEGKSKYVPKSGCLLGSRTVAFEEGESAFDVLKRVCSDSGIALEYSYAPIYGSYYVEGIGNLYQFDCGDESGWMFKVNGWFPNYGCSEFKLSDGDAITFCYTCRGLGEDVGA